MKAQGARCTSGELVRLEARPRYRTAVWREERDGRAHNRKQSGEDKRGAPMVLDLWKKKDTKKPKTRARIARRLRNQRIMREHEREFCTSAGRSLSFAAPCDDDGSSEQRDFICDGSVV